MVRMQNALRMLMYLNIWTPAGKASYESFGTWDLPGRPKSLEVAHKGDSLTQLLVLSFLPSPPCREQAPLFNTMPSMTAVTDCAP